MQLVWQLQEVNSLQGIPLIQQCLLSRASATALRGPYVCATTPNSKASLQRFLPCVHHTAALPPSCYEGALQTWALLASLAVPGDPCPVRVTYQTHYSKGQQDSQSIENQRQPSGTARHGLCPPAPASLAMVPSTQSEATQLAPQAIAPNRPGADNAGASQCRSHGYPLLPFQLREQAAFVTRKAHKILDPVPQPACPRGRTAPPPAPHLLYLLDPAAGQRGAEWPLANGQQGSRSRYRC